MAGLTLTLTPDPGSRTQALDGDGRTLRITFEQPIPATTPTTLHLAGLRDRTGNTIVPFETTFTLTDSQAYTVLADTAAPRVLTVIDTAAGLVLTFDEPVEPPHGTLARRSYHDPPRRDAPGDAAPMCPDDDPVSGEPVLVLGVR